MIVIECDFKAMGINKAYKVSGDHDGNRHMYKNPEYKKYQVRVGECAKKVMKSEKPLNVPVKLYLKHSYRTRHHRDVDSPIKGILDALNKIVYDDDVQIDELWVKRVEGTLDKIQIGVEKL